MGPSPDSLFVRAVKRAFADALMVEIGRTRLGREATASAGGLSRGYLQRLLRAEQQATMATFISLAEGLGVPPEELFAKTMEHLSRIRPVTPEPEPPADREPQSE